MGPFPAAALAGYLPGALVRFVPAAYFRIAARNIPVNAPTFGAAARFHSAVIPLRYVRILVTNFLAVVFAATPPYPWARVRQYRCQAECTAVTLLAADAAFPDARTRAGGALGEELGAVADCESPVPSLRLRVFGTNRGGSVSRGRPVSPDRFARRNQSRGRRGRRPPARRSANATGREALRSLRATAFGFRRRRRIPRGGPPGWSGFPAQRRSPSCRSLAFSDCAPRFRSRPISPSS